MARATACVIFTAALLSSGCATITSSDVQQLSLTTRDADGKAVDNVQCTLRNDRGTWKAVSPGFVDIRRSAEDLIVECKKEGQPDGLLRAISRAAGGMFGNIIFGGGIGAIIDHSRGTGYNYPDELPVRMGSSVTADRRTQDTLANPEAAAGQPK
jgi:hypothetical protein